MDEFGVVDSGSVPSSSRAAEIITLSITDGLNAILSEEHKREICRSFYNNQNRDGGWGLHTEGPSTMVVTVLSYVSLRLLGKEANDGQGAMDKARQWILDHGGATSVSSWGKMWLSILGVFEWSGNNPVQPEIWMLPYILLAHPGRMWCHSRLIHLPVSYLYGRRFVCPISSTVLALREEIFNVPYHEIDWNQARNLCAKILNIKPQTLMHKTRSGLVSSSSSLCTSTNKTRKEDRKSPD